MYLNIGNGRYIREKRIIGIFDMDTATVCIATRQFLSRMQKEGHVNSGDADIPKSFLLLDKKEEKDKRKKRAQREQKEKRIVLCKFSSGVLFGRIGNEQSLSAPDESGEEET